MNQNVGETLFRQDEYGNYYWYKSKQWFAIENPGSNYAVAYQGQKYFTQEETNREKGILNVQKYFNDHIVRYNYLLANYQARGLQLSDNDEKEFYELGEELQIDYSQPLHQLPQITRDEAEKIYDNN